MGIVGVINNDIGVIGVVFEVMIMFFKVFVGFGGGFFSLVIVVIEYCMENGVYIISNSYGSGGNLGDIVWFVFVVVDVVGVLNIFLVGNFGNWNGIGDSVGYFVVYFEVVVVVVINFSDVCVFFLSIGLDVEVVVLGVLMFLIVLGLVVNGNYGYKFGILMVCFYVVGVVVLLMYVGIEFCNGGNGDILINDEMWVLFLLIVVDFGDLGFDNLYGNGCIDVVEVIN